MTVSACNSSPSATTVAVLTHPLPNAARELAEQGRKAHTAIGRAQANGLQGDLIRAVHASDEGAACAAIRAGASLPRVEAKDLLMLSVHIGSAWIRDVLLAAGFPGTFASLNTALNREDVASFRAILTHAPPERSAARDNTLLRAAAMADDDGFLDAVLTYGIRPESAIVLSDLAFERDPARVRRIDRLLEAGAHPWIDDAKQISEQSSPIPDPSDGYDPISQEQACARLEAAYNRWLTGHVVGAIDAEQAPPDGSADFGPTASCDVEDTLGL